MLPNKKANIELFDWNTDSIVKYLLNLSFSKYWFHLNIVIEYTLMWKLNQRSFDCVNVSVCSGTDSWLILMDIIIHWKWANECVWEKFLFWFLELLAFYNNINIICLKIVFFFFYLKILFLHNKNVCLQSTQST